ncbi:MAG: hypothetical protein NVS3B12_05140 [Acidimicrobiales bacterium]
MIVAVQVTVLAPPRPAMLHSVTPVTGIVDVVVPPVGQPTEAVQVIIVTMVAKPVGVPGVAGL